MLIMMIIIAMVGCCLLVLLSHLIVRTGVLYFATLCVCLCVLCNVLFLLANKAALSDVCLCVTHTHTFGRLLGIGWFGSKGGG